MRAPEVSMCVDEETLRLLTAVTPRPVFQAGETALAILESELASVAALDLDLDLDLDLSSPDRHERIAAAARECLRRGTRWDHRRREPRQGQAAPLPDATPAPTPWRHAGSPAGRSRAAEALAHVRTRLGLDPHRHRHGNPGTGSTRCCGWAIWPEDGVWMVGLCDGVGDQDGLLVDVSSATATATAAACAGASPIAGPIPVWAFIGLRVKEFEAVVRPVTRLRAGARSVSRTSLMLSRIREKRKAHAVPGILLTRLPEAKANRRGGAGACTAEKALASEAGWAGAHARGRPRGA